MVDSAALDRVLRAATDAGRVPGVVAGVTDRQGLTYCGAAGLAQTGARVPMRADTVFRIASMTKLVTTFAVLQLHEQGLDLDAPFARYFAGYRQPPVLRSFDFEAKTYTTAPAGREITVRELLTHTAGYGYWFLNPELRALLGREPEHFNPPFLMYEPGSRFQYGISTDVLGQLIQPVTGIPLAEYFQRRLFEPLGMRDTTYAVPLDATRLASLHALGPSGFTENPNETVGELPRGGSGLYSTAPDYLALLRLLLNSGSWAGEQLLHSETVAALGRNQIGDLPAIRQTSAAPHRTADFAFMDGGQKFGLGVLIETRDRPSGRPAGSYGWAGIFNTYYWVDPQRGIAGVVCMQLGPFSMRPCLALYDAFERAVYAGLK